MYDHMLSFPFRGPESENQALHVRTSSVPTLFAGCLNRHSLQFFVVARVGLCCGFLRFCGLILVPPDGPKMGQ